MRIILAIGGARLIDGTPSAPVESSVVLVGDNGRIAAVGRSGELAIPEGVPTFDAPGMTLLPGLIDGHQHLTVDKSLYASHSVGRHARADVGLERRLVRASHNAQLALAAGITTLRDCGAADFSILALRDAIDAGETVGLRILACGRPLTTTAGHFYFDWGVDSADEMRKAVRQLASRGVDFIKVMVSGGTTTPGTNLSRSQYTREELRTGVEDAHRLWLRVAAHAISTDSIDWPPRWASTPLSTARGSAATRRPW